MEDEQDDVEFNEFDEIENVLETELGICNNKRGQVLSEFKSTPCYMNRFEKARIIGIRAEAIEKGAKILIDLDLDYPELKKLYDPVKIATQELEDQVLNMTVRRYLPNGNYEDWNVHELIIIN